MQSSCMMTESPTKLKSIFVFDHRTKILRSRKWIVHCFSTTNDYWIAVYVQGMEPINRLGSQCQFVQGENPWDKFLEFSITRNPLIGWKGRGFVVLRRASIWPDFPKYAPAEFSFKRFFIKKAGKLNRGLCRRIFYSKRQRVNKHHKWTQTVSIE